MKHLNTVVMVDAAFYLRVAQKHFGKQEPDHVAAELAKMALKHVGEQEKIQEYYHLHRVFVYDSPPLELKTQTPVTKRPINLADTPSAVWRRKFHECLLQKRKFVLRLGEIAPVSKKMWELRESVVRELLASRKTPSDIVDGDFKLNVRQKGVDMLLGTDIARLAYRNQVDQIVLVSGDADFVPAAKIARSEGIDFILDPMREQIMPKLSKHVDGIKSFIYSQDHASVAYSNFSDNDQG